MLRSRLTIVTAVMLLASACGGYSGPAPTPVPTPSPTPSPTPGGSAAITIPVGASTLANRAFNPAQLDVPVGTTVTWTNTDSTAHTTTSDGAGWNSGTLQPRAQFSTTFSDAGTFRYHCSIHPDMVGTVVVH
jgi:plastocyanin